MEKFSEAINFCGFCDLGFISPKFIWLYQKFDGKQIQEQLDRALATPDWMNLFPNTKLHHLSSLVLDHSSLLLRMTQKPRKMKTKIEKMFRFESMWLKDQRCEEVVKDTWEERLVTSSEHVQVTCLDKCRTSFKA